MPIVDSGVYYVISTFSNLANEYFTIAYKLSGSEMGGSWFAFIKNTMSSINWTRVDVPSFYKNYNDLASLSSAVGTSLSNRHWNFGLDAGDTIEINFGYVGYFALRHTANGLLAMAVKNYSNISYINENLSGKITITPKTGSTNILQITNVSDTNYSSIELNEIG